MEVRTLQGTDLHLSMVGSSRFSVLYESALGRAHVRSSFFGKEAAKNGFQYYDMDWRLLPR